MGNGAKMLTRSTKHRLLLFTALFHLLTDLAFAGDVILCVGPNDHVAVETEHLSNSGCQRAGNTSPSDDPGASTAAGDCDDRPLHVEAEMASSSNDGSDTRAKTIAFAGVVRPDRLIAAPHVRQRARAPDLPPGIHAHRTIVLLI